MGEQMDEAAFKARLRELLGDEADDPRPGLYWLSFADPNRPEGDQFLGGCVVEAIGTVHAQQRTSELGINPGGEVQVLGPGPVDTVASGWRDRLLTRAEIEQAEAVAWAEEATDG